MAVSGPASGSSSRSVKFYLDPRFGGGRLLGADFLDHWILPLFYATGAFIVGWLARGWKDAVAEGDAALVVEDEDADLGRLSSRWICPHCQRRRVLPIELDQKVLVCNLCQVRLSRDDGFLR